VCGLNRGSCCRAAGAGIVNDILEKARKNNVTIHFPVDYVTGNKWGEDCEVSSATDETGIPDGWQGYDCGPRSSAIFAEAIGRANTIIWNGYLSSSSLLLLFLLAHPLDVHISHSKRTCCCCCCLLVRWESLSLRTFRLVPAL